MAYDIPILDPFTRADATTLGSNWSVLSEAFSSTYHNQGVIGNQMYNPGPQYNNYMVMYWNVQTFGPDCECALKIATHPGAVDDSCDVYVRTKDPGLATYDGYGFSAYFIDNTQCYIYRVDNGAVTVLGAKFTCALVSGDAIKIRAVGSTISAHKWTGSTGLWAELASRTDTTYAAAGYAAHYLQNDAAGARYDDFAAWDYAPFPPVPRDIPHQLNMQSTLRM